MLSLKKNPHPRGFILPTRGWGGVRRLKKCILWYHMDHWLIAFVKYWEKGVICFTFMVLMCA